MHTKINKFFKIKNILKIFFIIILLFNISYIKAEANNGKKVIGYFTQWGINTDYSKKIGRIGYDISDIPGEKLTHINYSFVDIKDGKIIASNLSNFKTNVSEIKKLKQKYPHLKFLVSVGGWNFSKAFSDLASTNEGRVKFSKSSKSFIEKYGFDGVDIDWEYPVIKGGQLGIPEDKQNFTLLMKELKNQLGDNYFLSSAMSGSPRGIDGIEYDRIGEYVDWVNIMTYDYHGSWDKTTGHNSPLYNNNDNINSKYNINSAVSNILSKGFPANKLVIGVPFYGRTWRGVTEEYNIYAKATGAGIGENGGYGVLSYKTIKSKYLNKNGYKYYFDNVSKVPYLYNKTTKNFVSFDDKKSIGLKAKYIKEKDLAGIMIWELSKDDGELLGEINLVFNQKVISQIEKNINKNTKIKIDNFLNNLEKNNNFKKKKIIKSKILVFLKNIEKNTENKEVFNILRYIYIKI